MSVNCTTEGWKRSTEGVASCKFVLIRQLPTSGGQSQTLRQNNIRATARPTGYHVPCERARNLLVHEVREVSGIQASLHRLYGSRREKKRKATPIIKTKTETNNIKSKPMLLFLIFLHRRYRALSLI